MAIVRMNKITLVGLEKHKETIIDSLMKLGVVDISNIDIENMDESLSDILIKDGDEESVSQLEAEIAKIKSAIDYLSRYDHRKKGLFEPKRSVDAADYEEIIRQSDRLFSDVVEKIDAYEATLLSLKAEENKLLNMIAALEPWRTVDVPLEETETKTSVVSLGVIPPDADFESISRELLEKSPECYVKKVNEDKDQTYILIIYHKDSEETVTDVLKRSGFSKVTFKDMTGTPSDNISKANRRIKEIDAKREKVIEKIAALAGEKDNLEILYDHMAIELDRKRALSNLARTGKTFILEGWVPEEIAGKVKKAIAQVCEDCLVYIREPEKDEEFPILLKNHPLVKPFELVTELYSLPSSKGIDPNALMAPFFFVFFGMMVSDAGYGLVMAILTGILLKKYKMEGMAFKLIKLLYFGGISTLIWGALFGGWFGNIVEAVTGGKYSIPPLWFNPLDDPMKLLLWSFIFGLLHIFVGMGLKGYMLIREGKVLDAIYDIASWYVLIIGLVMLALGGVLGTIGKYAAVIGAATLVLTQGRGEKNVIKRLFKGILSLYGITSYLSDVLSYSRLLALGLATGVIATVINTMGTLFGLNLVGILILVVVFTIGTVFNIAINALGAYVHSSRLQYVEFFGKFYEGGGKAYQPFKINTKYIELKRQGDDSECGMNFL